MSSFSKRELSLLKKLNNPAKVQDYLNKLSFNFEKDGDTLKSPASAMRSGSAHCLEGAILGAYILSRHGYPPLIVHLEAAKGDFDHVIALFKERGKWGALSKTNHAVLRYREPVYRDVRELVMSYFHEYFLNSNGKKTLRRYSRPLNLNIFTDDWQTTNEDLFGIEDALDNVQHYDIVPKKILKKLRPADTIEREAGKITEKRR